MSPVRDRPVTDDPAPAPPATGDRPPRRDPRDTPAMRQYTRFKKQHPRCVLFFRMGDFYEMFDDDAVLVSKVLGLTLTRRTAGIPMAGVPHHALDGYVRQMIEQGYRVAICEQMEDPRQAKGIVDRAVTRVVTPGTLVDEALLDDACANRVAAVDIVDDACAVIAVAELSTGEFTLMSLPVPRVSDELCRLRPSELLFAETADGRLPRPLEAVADATGCALTPRPDLDFRRDDAVDLLKRHFGVQTLAGFGLDDTDPTLAAGGGLLRYLLETQAPDGGRGGRLGHLRPPQRDADDTHLIIDATSLRSLEIERTMRSGQTAGSLLSMLPGCRTAMGKRLIRDWLCFPLRRADAIESRQRAVASLVEDHRLAEGLRSCVGSVQDVARIAGRVSMRRGTPRDLVALGQSITPVAATIDLLEGRTAFADHRHRLAGHARRLDPLRALIDDQCVDAPPAHLREGGLFRDGVDEELDHARGLQRDANAWLAEYQSRLVAETGIPSLKVGYNKVFGYYIEITHAHGAKVPAAFSRKQTLKNAERYVTPELKTFEDEVTTARARAIEREQTLFERLCVEAADHAGSLLEYARCIAELDVLACFADAAVRHRYARPVIVDEPIVDIRQGRHPVLDRTLGDRFVPNDCRLGRGGGPTEASADLDEASASDPATLALITGPNMAGKSTYIRQAALIVLLAHTGSFVPAEAATIGLVDRIFTRIGASDELHAGHSTFMVEMTETANILHHATDRSLVILDEIGRGTSTLDGLALAWAIAEAIAGRGCRTLFATHYHELTSLADRRSDVKNLHVSVREWGDEVVFLYRILPGRTDRSYGVHVAKIAGLPRDTVSRAAEVLETLAVHTGSPQIPAEATADRTTDTQLDLFKEYLEHPAVDELRRIDLAGLSPLEAFDALRRLHDLARHG